jgi:hypothetical protein
MMIKYAVALAVLIVLATFFTWAFLPARYLPGNRVRSLQVRLHLRLHPGKGFASILGCGCAGGGWPRCAVPGGSGGPCRCGCGRWRRGSTRCSLGGRTGGTACGFPWKSTSW